MNNIDTEHADFNVDNFPDITTATKHLTDTISKYSKLHILTVRNRQDTQDIKISH